MKEQIVIVWDCRHKEKMVLKRISGDVALEFYEILPDKSELLEFGCWFQMKKPCKVNFEEIVKLFKSIRALLKRQDE